jgi:hypothetical protein
VVDVGVDTDRTHRTGRDRLHRPVRRGGRTQLAGRKWNAISIGNSQCLLELDADTSKCIAAGNNGLDVVLHPCNGGSGVVWIRQTPGSHDLWLNRLTNKYLTGRNQTGSQFVLFYRGCLDGGLQQFDFA